MLWEHEVYNAMDYKAPTSYFHTFEAEDCMVAFNFANETEAFILRYVDKVERAFCYGRIRLIGKYICSKENLLSCYRNILLSKLNAKRQRRQERRARETQSNSTLPRTYQSNLSPFTITSGPSSNLENGAPTVDVHRSASSSSMYNQKKKKNEQDLKRKLTKDDISLPSNFRCGLEFYFALYLLLTRAHIGGRV